MKEMKRLLCILAALLCGIALTKGQTVIQPKQIDYGLQGVLYKEERAFDLQLHTNGIAIAYNVGEIRKYYLTRYYHVGIGILKHPKEYRQAVNFQGGNLLLKSSSAFAYGKQNNLIIARAGIGEKRYFSEKAKRKGVAVGISYEGGFSLGILKPYYLNLNKIEITGRQQIVAEKYTPENADVFLDINRIYGSASFFKGIDEITVLPGLHGKAGAHFSVGAFDEYVRAVEVGVMIDVYFKRVPIMVIENNLPFFINAYGTVQIGKRR